MALVLMLDASPLGRLVNARHNLSIGLWVDQALARGATIYLPEMSDFELRRGLLSMNATRSLRVLDELSNKLTYLSLNTAAMRHAAALWAQAKQSGQMTADLKELNGDVILAAQALQVGATVITENVAHLSLFVRTIDWREVEVSAL